MFKTLITISLMFLCNGFDISEELMNIILKGKMLPKSARTTAKQRIYIQKLPVPSNPNLNNTNFCAIPFFYDGTKGVADPADEKDIPFIARVFHSKDKFKPFLCTAVAVMTRVFATAALCVATAKVTYTTVFYKNTRFQAKAIVLPSRPSKQMFDDIGFIVVHDTPVLDQWSVITGNPKVPGMGKNRTDDHFLWLDDWNLWQEPKSSVAGFLVREKTPDKQKLYKLDQVFVSNHLCNELVPPKKNTNDYFVPCYHAESVQEHENNVMPVKKYLRGLGHVVYLNRTSPNQLVTLVGIATWGCGALDYYLPVGIAMPNSDSYKEDSACAYKISIAPLQNGYKGICDT